MNSSVWLAILAFCFYGLAAPLMKYLHDAGVSTRDFIFVASLSTLTISIFGPWEQPLFSTLSTNFIILIAIITSYLLSGGFISLNQALAVPLAIASVVFAISSANPLLGSLLNLFVMGESKKVILWLLVSSSVLIVVGTIGVLLSVRNN